MKYGVIAAFKSYCIQSPSRKYYFMLINITAKLFRNHVHGIHGEKCCGLVQSPPAATVSSLADTVEWIANAACRLFIQAAPEHPIWGIHCQIKHLCLRAATNSKSHWSCFAILERLWISNISYFTNTATSSQWWNHQKMMPTLSAAWKMGKEGTLSCFHILIFPMADRRL